MSGDEQDSETKQPKTKQPWVAPRLSYLGSVRELVQGAGKNGSNADPDPNGDKRGIG